MTIICKWPYCAKYNYIGEWTYVVSEQRRLSCLGQALLPARKEKQDKTYIDLVSLRILVHTRTHVCKYITI